MCISWTCQAPAYNNITESWRWLLILFSGIISSLPSPQITCNIWNQCRDPSADQNWCSWIHIQSFQFLLIFLSQLHGCNGKTANHTKHSCVSHAFQNNIILLPLQYWRQKCILFFLIPGDQHVSRVGLESQPHHIILCPLGVDWHDAKFRKILLKLAQFTHLPSNFGQNTNKIFSLFHAHFLPYTNEENVETIPCKS